MKTGILKMPIAASTGWFGSFGGFLFDSWQSEKYFLEYIPNISIRRGKKMNTHIRIMKTRLLMISSLITLAVFGFGNIVSGQNEVTESVTTSYYGTSKVLPLGPDRGYVSWESFGVVVSDTGQGLFHNVTIRCVGGYLIEKGSWESNGYCAYTLKDGEKVFLSIKFGGKTGTPPPPAQGTATMIGGTGKYSGIQGQAAYTSYFLRPSAEGISQSYNKAKIIYKLP